MNHAEPPQLSAICRPRPWLQRGVKRLWYASSMEAGMSAIHVGTCNWADFTEWYPKGVKANERIRYYAQHFSVVEVDSTFYHLMPRRNFEGWAEKTPDGFV